MFQIKKRKDGALKKRLMATICFYQDTRHERELYWIQQRFGIGYISRRNDGMTELRINGYAQVRDILKKLIPYKSYSPFLVWPRNDSRWKTRGLMCWGIVPHRTTAHMGKMPSSSSRLVGTDEDIVCAPGNRGRSDERTGMNWPLVYQLSCQGHRWVAMSGCDNRWKHISGKRAPRLGIVMRLLGDD